MSQAAIRGTDTLNFQPLGYKYIRYVDNYMEVLPEGSANIMASIKSLNDTSKVSIHVYLQRFDGDWTTIKKLDA